MKNNSELILDYLNGTLMNDEEQSLFSQMAYDIELRDDFRSFVNIDKTFKSTAKSFIPSNNVTNDIFKKLGYSIPSVSTDMAAPAVILPESQPAPKAKLKRYLLFLLMTGAIALSVMFLMEAVNRHDNTVICIPVIRSIAVEQKKNMSTDNETGFVKESPAPRRRNEHPAQNSPVVSDNNEDIAASVSQTVEAIAESGNSRLIPDISFGVVIPLNNTDFSNMPDNTIGRSPGYLGLSSYNPFLSELSGISIEMRGSSVWHIPRETIDPNSFSKFNNLGITVLYNFKDDYYLGLDVRQETFFTTFTEINEFGQRFRTEQQPNFTSLCGTARYVPLQISSFSPYLQVAAGGSYYGAVARLAAGLDYELYDGFILTLQGELSNLIYRHNQDWNNTRKLGLNYGMRYAF